MTGIKFNFREYLFKIWYLYVNKVDKNAEVLFMNYGYSNNDQIITLDQKDEINRYSIQLYAHFTADVPIKDKDIVEIGSGRGGGLNFLTKTFKPTGGVIRLISVMTTTTMPNQMGSPPAASTAVRNRGATMSTIEAVSMIVPSGITIRTQSTIISFSERPDAASQSLN